LRPFYKLSRHRKYKDFRKEFLKLKDAAAILDPYFLTGIKRMVVSDLDFERLMMHLRRLMLECVTEEGAARDMLDHPESRTGEWLAGRRYMAGDVPVGPAIAKRFYLAPALGAIGLGLAFAMRKRGASPALVLRLLALSLACLAFFRYVIFRFHLSTGNALAGPLFLLTLVAVFETFRDRVRSPRRLGAALAAVGALAAFGMNGPGRLLDVVRNASKYRERTAPPAGTVPLTVPRGGGIRVSRDEERDLRALIEFTDRHAPAGAPVLDLSNRAGLYFFLRRVNPTRFAEVPPMAAFEEEVLRDLERRRPALVFLESGTWLDAIDDVPNSRRIPRVWRWVLENYPARAKVGDTVVALPAKPEL